MNLEKQLTSLKLSKKLEELGVNQESLYMWNVPNPKNPKQDDEYSYPVNEYVPKLFSHDEWDKYTDDYIPPEGQMYPAYTVAEMGEILPVAFWSSKHTIRWECGKSMLEYDNWIKGLKQERVDIEYADTEANARAKMLIYLIENKLLDPIT